MKCSEIIELGMKCSVADALKRCPDYDKKTGECLRYKRELAKLNKQYGCHKVFVKKEILGQ